MKIIFFKFSIDDTSTNDDRNLVKQSLFEMTIEKRVYFYYHLLIMRVINTLRPTNASRKLIPPSAYIITNPS